MNEPLRLLLERKGEAGALAEAASDFDLAAVRLEEPSGYGQPGARPESSPVSGAALDLSPRKER